ncbi:MAG TPA: Trp biosynthesis-associated membrane protein [Dermatophilaceae bacterium]|nr:Trp biosynthesis-associated membrane protein [Dermatophilaceae bacterium]
MAKRTVLPLVLAAAAALLACATQTWVQGTPADAVLGQSLVRGSGAATAPLVPAATLVAVAATLAVATAGRFLRALAATVAPVAGVAAVVATLQVGLDPGGALGPLAAQTVGRAGSVATDATSTGWLWAGLVAAVALGVGTLGVAVVARTWVGLPSRYDAPVAAAGVRGVPGSSDNSDSSDGSDSRGDRGERGRSDGSDGADRGGAARHTDIWDRLSQGEDPTEHGTDLPGTPGERAEGAGDTGR